MHTTSLISPHSHTTHTHTHTVSLSHTHTHTHNQDIACGAAYIHGLAPSIVHRDINSSNVLLTGDIHALTRIVEEGRNEVRGLLGGWCFTANTPFTTTPPPNATHHHQNHHNHNSPWPSSRTSGSAAPWSAS